MQSKKEFYSVEALRVLASKKVTNDYEARAQLTARALLTVEKLSISFTPMKGAPRVITIPVATVNEAGEFQYSRAGKDTLASVLRFKSNESAVHILGGLMDRVEYLHVAEVQKWKHSFDNRLVISVTPVLRAEFAAALAAGVTVEEFCAPAVAAVEAPVVIKSYSAVEEAEHNYVTDEANLFAAAQRKSAAVEAEVVVVDAVEAEVVEVEPVVVVDAVEAEAEVVVVVEVARSFFKSSRIVNALAALRNHEVTTRRRYLVAQKEATNFMPANDIDPGCYDDLCTVSSAVQDYYRAYSDFLEVSGMVTFKGGAGVNDVEVVEAYREALATGIEAEYGIDAAAAVDNVIDATEGSLVKLIRSMDAAAAVEAEVVVEVTPVVVVDAVVTVEDIAPVVVDAVEVVAASVTASNEVYATEIAVDAVEAAVAPVEAAVAVTVDDDAAVDLASKIAEKEGYLARRLANPAQANHDKAVAKLTRNINRLKVQLDHVRAGVRAGFVPKNLGDEKILENAISPVKLTAQDRADIQQDLNMAEEDAAWFAMVATRNAAPARVLVNA